MNKKRSILLIFFEVKIMNTLVLSFIIVKKIVFFLNTVLKTKNTI